jgi:release factor glutamine methyltransferase
MTITESLRAASALLGGAGVPDSRLDAEYLLSHVLKQNRMALLINGREELSPAHQAAFDQLLMQRARRVPLQYLLQSQGFMGLSLYVDENVLIPRPETELLCEQALLWLKERHQIDSPAVLDLCTGSGALAVAIAHALPNAKVSAADLSPKALDVARRNADAYHAQVSFFQGDFLDAVLGQKFDLIVCNPPYIPSSECSRLQPEVLMEPSMALNGGEDGLHFYKKLAAESTRFLCPGGALFCEVGFNQEQAVQALFSPTFPRIEILQDLSGIPRIVSAFLALGGSHV